MCSSNADIVETESLESVFSNSNEANCENQLEENCHSQYDQCSNDFVFNDLHVCSDSVFDSMLSDTEVPVDGCEITSQITNWANKNAISLNAMSELFKILKKYHPQLPSDPRTLLKTQTQYMLKEMCGGLYYHFGVVCHVKEKVEDSFSNGFYDIDTKLKLQLNIDGLPLFKSTNDQFWPILGRIENLPDSRPFIIGLFYGESKPSNVNQYLEQFIEEFRELERNGLEVDEERFSISISSVICDAPAKAFIKNIKQFSGYYGCDKCVQPGEWVGKMTFPEVNADLGTDAAFNEMRDEDHHKGPSPFHDTGIKLQMVSQFPLDYMHLVCLGVVKRLMLL